MINAKQVPTGLYKFEELYGKVNSSKDTGFTETSSR
jgi:hypothetical protein